jgi:ATP-dependent helicase/nuclease subunit A
MNEPTRMIPPDQDQRDAILQSLDQTLLVEAAAGTGKTTSMVGRMTALLREGKCEVDSLVAVTFTRKAAGELRSRFQLAVEKGVREEEGIRKERLSKALSRIERCFIGTIHSFCGRMLRERPVEAGVNVSFRELDDTADALIREQVWETYVAELFATNNQTLQRLVTFGLGIHQLKNAFLTLANYPDVEEWPTEEIALPDFQPVITALEAYVTHMMDVAVDFPKDTGTDELMPKYKLIPRLFGYYNISNPNRLMDILDQFGPVTVRKTLWPGGKAQGEAEEDNWNRFQEKVLAPVKEQWYACRYAIILEIVFSAIHAYDRRRDAMGVLNFQDLLMRTASLLRENPDVRRYFQKHLTHILVDEFQDTDPIQAEILLLLTGSDVEETDWKRCKPLPGSLFVVGDPKQSIYRFRRADIVTYNLVKRIILESGGAVLTLCANFRTDKPILDWVNAVFSDQFPDTANDYNPHYVAFEPGKEAVSKKQASVFVLESPGEFKKNEEVLGWESDVIARSISLAVREKGANPGDFMIVAWNTKQLNVYAQALQAVGVPHQVSGGSSLNQAEALDRLRLCLNAILHPDDPIALVGLLRSEVFGFSDEELYAYTRAGGYFSFLRHVPQDQPFTDKFQTVYARLKNYERWMRRMPLVAAIEKIVGDLGLLAWSSVEAGGNEETGNLAKSIELLRAVQNEFVSSLDILRFLEELIQKVSTYDSVPSKPYNSSVVQIMNLHKVKGLEAPHVFLANPSGFASYGVTMHVDRAGPHTRGMMQIEQRSGWTSIVLAKPTLWDQVAEEEQKYHDAEKIRLYYVAATRAGQTLCISLREPVTENSNNRNPWGFFAPALAGCPRFPIAAALPTQPERVFEMAEDACEQAVQSIQERWNTVLKPTHDTKSVKTLAMEKHGEAVAGVDYGREWGSVIHILLQRAMEKPNADLHRLAQTLLEQYDLEPEWEADALATVRAVVQSALWKRAQASEQCFVEIPFQALWPETGGGVPTVLRGVIDLVFKEDRGWVLVDYKTDVGAKAHPEKLVALYRPQIAMYKGEWERITGETVYEMGLYFVSIDRYVVCE